MTARAPQWAQRLGVSFRQLDYWTRVGYLQPENNGGGSGTRRVWPLEERRVAGLMVRLRACGVEVETAAAVARLCVVSGTDLMCELGEGICLAVCEGFDERRRELAGVLDTAPL